MLPWRSCVLRKLAAADAALLSVILFFNSRPFMQHFKRKTIIQFIEDPEPRNQLSHTVKLFTILVFLQKHKHF